MDLLIRPRDSKSASARPGRWWLVLLSFYLACIPAGMAAAQPADEITLRALMVYNLVRFIEWPSGTPAGPALQLCVVSDDLEQIGAFNALAGKAVREYTLRVQRRGPLARLEDCHAVYFDRLDTDLLADKLTALAALPVLTLSSTPSSGAMIELTLADSRLVFDVSTTALRGAGLKLASRVLQLARTVHR